jgi:HK97 family phage major capsid protein
LVSNEKLLTESSKLNTETLAHRRKQLDVEAADIDALINTAIETKSYGELDSIKKRLDDLADEKELLDRWEERNKAVASDPRYAAVMANGGDLGTQPDVPVTKATGKDLCPLAFKQADLKLAFKAHQNRQPFTLRAAAKGFSTVDSLLPAELAPGVVEHQHEWRIMDRLQAVTISAPSYEFIVHNFAADTGTLAGPPFAGPVAEGATKPEYVPGTTSQTVTAVKLAMHTAVSYETLADYESWLGYITTESFRQVVDAENQQLLYGTGSGGQVLGLANTSGILTHNAATDPSSFNAIDSIEAAITQLRVGNALAEARLLILHPTCWASIRRIKTTSNAYAIGDPLREQVNSIWGVPVLVTTLCTNGQGFLLDLNKFGTAVIREGLVMHQGTSGTDFIQNLARWVFETRLALAVVRPQAVCQIVGLPTV